MTELKPCPFCGSKPQKETQGKFKAIICTNYQCGAEVNAFWEWDKAIEAWNRREK